MFSSSFIVTDTSAAADLAATSALIAASFANLAALIALLLVLFLGVVMFSLMCCCVKSWVFAASASSNKPQKLKQEPSPHLDVRAMSAMGGAGIYNSPTSLLEDGPISGGGGGGGVSGGTDNPLWIDQKYKAYEEQELTMTVFSDQDNSVISGNNGAGNGSQSHAPGKHLINYTNISQYFRKMTNASCVVYSTKYTKFLNDFVFFKSNLVQQVIFKLVH